MEYRKDKRTKNLTLRDIHVGDWVQVWSEQTERYSPPLKITQICDDGTVYLIIDEENRLDPWEENIKDIDALPIDVDLLRGFGFELREYEYDSADYVCMRDGDNMPSFLLIKLRNEYVIATHDAYYYYFHQFQEYIPNIKLEWKGVNKYNS